MYGESKQALHPADAAKLSGEVAKNAPLTKVRFDATVERIKHEQSVAADKLAAIDYCFGGSVVLEMTRAGEPLKAVLRIEYGASG